MTRPIARAKNAVGEQIERRRKVGATRRDMMVAIEALATLAVMWALVIWGSSYFNRNVV